MRSTPRSWSRSSGFGSCNESGTARSSRTTCATRSSSCNASRAPPSRPGPCGRKFGNFEKSAGYPPKTLATRFSLWSGFRERLGAHPPLAIAALLGGNLIAAAATYRRASLRGRLFREGLLTLVLMAMLAFAVCTFAQAPPDLSRSLYAYHALCDLLIVADAGWIAEALARRTKRLATASG